MSTTIRPEVSERNLYWIEKHRYYELKHFCLQYPVWKKVHESLDGMNSRDNDISHQNRKGSISKPTERYGIAKAYYSERMDMLEHIATETDEIIGRYILKGVTEGYSYDCMKAKLDIPCCKSTYYDLYRRFFWLLDKARQ